MMFFFEEVWVCLCFLWGVDEVVFIVDVVDVV